MNLPVEVINALIGPVYDELTEDQAIDGVADEIVKLQLRLLDDVGWTVAEVRLPSGKPGSEQR